MVIRTAETSHQLAVVYQTIGEVKMLFHFHNVFRDKPTIKCGADHFCDDSEQKLAWVNAILPRDNK